MRIAYISSAVIPSRTASSIHVMKMSQAFALNGHNVLLLVPDKKRKKQTNVDDIYAFYGLKKSFQLVDLPWLSIGLPFRIRSHFFGRLASRKAYEFQPDLVYCRHIYSCFFADQLGLSVILELHFPIRSSDWLSKWMFNKVVQSRHLNRLVVITYKLKEYLELNYPKAKGKIQVAPDGADPVSDDIKGLDLTGQTKRLQVGYVGHLYRGKGMEIISRLAWDCVWADFHIVGGKDIDIQKSQERYKDIENLIFHGYQPHNFISSYLKGFDVVLLPNLDQVSTNKGRDIGRWTSPLKAFEYMAAGKAIICSDLPVLQEIFEHGHNAMLCSPDNLEVWKRTLKYLKENREFRKYLGQEAKRDFCQKYTWQARAKKVLS